MDDSAEKELIADMQRFGPVSKYDIAGWRGEPEGCDFCGWRGDLDFLEPEEAGAWACWHCLWRWQTNDIAGALVCVYGEPIPHGANDD